MLSVAQLNNIGHKLEFQNRKLKIIGDKGNLIGTGVQTKGNLFYLDPIFDICLFVKAEDVWLWHKRLFHVNFDNHVSISSY